jgi:hypothetical protein
LFATATILTVFFTHNVLPVPPGKSGEAAAFSFFAVAKFDARAQVNDVE